MTSWRYSSNRKHHQRRLNRAMRELNKNIEQDSLWRGRFYVRQIESHFYRYEDLSGWELVVKLCFYDKESSTTRIVTGAANSLLFGSTLWWHMNDFIMYDVDYWGARRAENGNNT